MATPADNVVPLTGDPLIDGLTWGSAWQFDGGSHVLSYSLSLNDNPNGGSWSQAQADAVRNALAAWSNVANISFVESGSGTVYDQSPADIVITLTGNEMQSLLPGLIGFTLPPSPSFVDALLVAAGETRATNRQPEGDIQLDNYYSGFDYLNAGGVGLMIMLHEIGHALGLKHTDDGHEARPTFAGLGISGLDSNLYTVMSYTNADGQLFGQNQSSGNAATPMPLDILAIQEIYGANTSYHTGDDTYQLNEVGVVRTIWDAGGTDTLSASSFSVNDGYHNATIDLRPGHYSQIGAETSRFGIAYNVTIENAIGGAGNDTLIGSDGANALTGGPGNDSLDGGNGFDQALYSNSMSGYQFGLNASNQITVTDIDLGNGDDGTDALIGIEGAQFADSFLDLGQIRRETQVSSATSGDQFDPSVATLIDGGWIIAWDGISSGTMLLQRYGFDGTAVGVAIHLDSGTGGYGTHPRVAPLADGGWVVTWVSNYMDSYGDVFVQRYHADGTELGGATRVNTYTSTYQYDSSVAALSDGGWVVTWSSSNQDGSGAGVYAQRYQVSGTAAGTEIRVNTHTESDQKSSSVTALVDGGWVVVWLSHDPVTGDQIYYQRFDADGTAVGVETLVGRGWEPSVAALSDGGWVAAWTSGWQDGSWAGITAQRYNADGTPEGGPSIVNTYTTSSQDNPSVTALPGAGYVVVWQSKEQDGSGYGIYAQRFDAGGSMVGMETRVNTYSYNGQDSPQVAALPDGGYVVTWQSSGQDGSDYGIYSRRFGPESDAVNWSGDANANVLNWSGSVAIELDGGAGNDTLTGGNGADFLDGGAGADSMLGCAGDDLYIVDDTGDRVTELAGDGSDSVKSSAPSFTLTANIEYLILAGTGNTNGSGNADPNTLTGNSGNNQLDGGAGNDVLNGGGGVDTLIGGAGDDQIYVDSGDDVVVEEAGEGTDTVSSSVSYTLVANIENLVLTDNATTGIGNALANVITGNSASNSLAGAAGDDTLTGDSGDDTMAGGAGNDTLSGGSGNDALTGSSGDDVLDGGSGSDTAIFSGPVGGYQIGLNANYQIIVADIDQSNGDEGSDTLMTAVDGLQFADGVFEMSQVQLETPVNTYSPNTQGHASVAALTDGGWVVTWRSDGQDGGYGGIYAQRYRADGTALDAETLINTYTDTNQESPSVAALSDGGWVITWQSYGQDSSGYGIFAQRYHADGTSAGGETRVNSYTTNDQIASSVVALSDGGWVVAWQSNGQDGDGNGIYVQRYAADGASVGGEVRVNSYTTNSQAAPSVASLSDGGWLVTWQSYDQDYYGGTGVYSQRYCSDGTTAGGETRINSYTVGGQYEPSVAALADGGWFVAWTSERQDGVIGQRYNAHGEAVGAEMRINTYKLSIQFDPSVAALSDGGWVVTWTSDLQDGSGYGIYSQRYHADGTAAGLESRVNTYTASMQAGSSVVALSDGGHVVTWSSRRILDVQYDSGVYFQRYDAYDNFVNWQGDASSNALNWSGSVAATLEGGGGNDTLKGGSGADRINGGSDSDLLEGGLGNDTLVGGEGHDLLNGGRGADRMQGGSGNDVYVVDNRFDQITELAGEGLDSVSSRVSHVLAENVENLYLTGTVTLRSHGFVSRKTTTVDSSIDGTGNGSDNLLRGNRGHNELDGLGGNDTLLGGAGADILRGGSGADRLVGGAGADVFVFAAGDGGATLAAADMLYDFEDGIDRIALAGGLDFADLTFSQGNGVDTSANNTVIRTGNGEYLAVLLNIGTGSIGAPDFYTLAV